MSSIFNSIKELVTPDLISKASTTLSEDHDNVSKAVTTAIPSILGSLLAKGNNPEVENALKDAGKAHEGILSSITHIFSGNSDENTEGVSKGLLGSILGDKTEGLTSLISKASGITKKSSSSLLLMITPLIGGFLGHKMLHGGLGISGLIGKLEDEKDKILGAVPAGLAGVLGVASLSHIGSGISDGINKIKEGTGNAVRDVEDGIKKSMNHRPKRNFFGWLKWIIPILLILLAIIVWRTCAHKRAMVENTEAIVGQAASEVKSMVENPLKEMTELSLPDGTRLDAYKGGIEDQLITFLQSDEYKNSTDESLKDKWFDFDNINFEFGSPNKLTSESFKQIDNVTAILKYFKDSKVKIGGYTDKKGDAGANMKLSQERAHAMKALFSGKGIGKQIVEAEGYGDKYATVSAEASDEERAIDRKMALRFEK